MVDIRLYNIWGPWEEGTLFDAAKDGDTDAGRKILEIAADLLERGEPLPPGLPEYLAAAFRNIVKSESNGKKAAQFLYTGKQPSKKGQDEYLRAQRRNRRIRKRADELVNGKGYDKKDAWAKIQFELLDQDGESIDAKTIGDIARPYLKQLKTLPEED